MKGVIYTSTKSDQASGRLMQIPPGRIVSASIRESLHDVHELTLTTPIPIEYGTRVVVWFYDRAEFVREYVVCGYTKTTVANQPLYTYKCPYSLWYDLKNTVVGPTSSISTMWGTEMIRTLSRTPWNMATSGITAVNGTYESTEYTDAWSRFNDLIGYIDVVTSFGASSIGCYFDVSYQFSDTTPQDYIGNRNIHIRSIDTSKTPKLVVDTMSNIETLEKTVPTDIYPYMIIPLNKDGQPSGTGTVDQLWGAANPNNVAWSAHTLHKGYPTVTERTAYRSEGVLKTDIDSTGDLSYYVNANRSRIFNIAPQFRFDMEFTDYVDGLYVGEAVSIVEYNMHDLDTYGTREGAYATRTQTVITSIEYDLVNDVKTVSCGELANEDMPLIAVSKRTT